MNLDHKSTTITLDWDDITTNELTSRLLHVAKQATKVYYRQSPCSGFHIKATFEHPVCVLHLRRMFKDDGRRIINDITNRPQHVHDILWDSKSINGIVWRAGPWEQFK